MRTISNFVDAVTHGLERGSLSHAMSMENDSIRSLRDRNRIIARDAKLNFREELLADRMGRHKRVCPCNICLGETRSLRFRSVVLQHLERYGRHPAHRGRTEVKFVMALWFLLKLHHGFFHISDDLIEDYKCLD